jgi:hypothetical protein
MVQIEQRILFALEWKVMEIESFRQSVEPKELPERGWREHLAQHH